MGTELQTKYQKLAHEYARLRAQLDVLKQGVVTEKTRRTELEEELRLKEQALRKHSQENESLGFRNQQLSKRVQMLQDELDSSGRSKKRNKDSHSQSPSVFSSTVQAEELAAKITENERLHTRIFEITQKSERAITQLKEKIAKLEQEVANNDVLVSELNKNHLTDKEALEEDRIMLQAKLEKVTNELMEARQLNMAYSNEQGEELVVYKPAETEFRLLNDKEGKQYNLYNVSNIDRSVSSKLDLAISAAVKMVDRFFANLSTLFMYLEQRAVVYPIDTSKGLPSSPHNQKLVEMLRGMSTYTDQLHEALESYGGNLDTSLMDGDSNLSNIGFILKSFATYMETTSAYIQLSIEAESLESICGAQLTEVNTKLCLSFQIVSGIVLMISEYVAALEEDECSPSIQSAILNRLQSSSTDLHNALKDLTNQFSAKVALEYQLPTATMKLQTANECAISAVTSLCAASDEVVEFFGVHSKALLTSLDQSSNVTTKQSHGASVMAKLRSRAVSFYDKLVKDPCAQVPYGLAVHLSQQFVGNTEKGDALERQVQLLKEKLSKVEQEKEQLGFDYDLLSRKHEMKVAQLKSDSNNTSPKTLSSSQTVVANGPVTDTSTLGSLTSQDLLVLADEEISAEMLIRQHSMSRLAEVNVQLQEAESKASFLHSQCSVLSKQLGHSNAMKKNLSTDLATAQQSIQQLQDQLATVSSGYESQLSTMSDHVCELRDTLLKREDELELLKRGSGKKKWNK